MKNKSKPKPKRPYRPPRVNRVNVRIDEVVLAGCKQVGTGVGAASCLTNCVNSGS